MKETELICPILSIVGDDFIECREEKCAIYDCAEGCCSILSLVAHLDRIVDGVYSIKE